MSLAAAAPPAAAGAPPSVAPPAAAALQQDDDVVIVESDEDDLGAQRIGNAHGAGPSCPAAAARPLRRPRAAPVAVGATTGAASSRGAHVIDLTSDSPPDLGDVQIVRSTVVPRQPMRGAKRPRTLPPAAAAAPAHAAGGAALPPALAALSPQKRELLARLYNPPPPPPPEPEPEGPKCGICMEVMGGSNGRQMASGSCGHVYCRDCLVEAVKAQKKCPTCRKGMQVRQIHNVFLNFS